MPENTTEQALSNNARTSVLKQETGWDKSYNYNSHDLCPMLWSKLKCKQAKDP